MRIYIHDYSFTKRGVGEIIKEPLKQGHDTLLVLFYVSGFMENIYIH